jgi:hypothetical protein
VSVDIIDAVLLNKKYEAGIQVHQGGEINMPEEAGTRMLMTNLKCKNVKVDIIDTALLDKKYEADINMVKWAETRMLKTNPKCKNNAAHSIGDPSTIQW